MKHVIPFQNNTAATVEAQLFVEKLFWCHQLLSVIACDGNSNRISRLCSTSLKYLQAKIAPSSPYHLGTVGKTGIENRKLENMTRPYVNFGKSDWDAYLLYFKIACNSSNFSFTYFLPSYHKREQHPQVPLMDSWEYQNRFSDS